MRFATFTANGREGLGVVEADGSIKGLLAGEADYPGDLDSLMTGGLAGLKKVGEALRAKGKSFAEKDVKLLPPLRRPGKIICVGLNYADHSAESGFKQPDYPTLFGRFNSSLIAHGDAILRPKLSEQLDYEGEMVAVIQNGGRNIPKASALDHVLGYSVFNDGSIRDYQFKAPQWTVGKNFDDTGAFGPYLVTADEVPLGGKGLKLETRLNGQVVQTTSTDDMVFDIASLISIISEAITLSPGDILVTGTPAGVGAGRKPPLWMKDGDVVEVEIEKIGLLRNPVKNEV